MRHCIAAHNQVSNAMGLEGGQKVFVVLEHRASAPSLLFCRQSESSPRPRPCAPGRTGFANSGIRRPSSRPNCCTGAHSCPYLILAWHRRRDDASSDDAVTLASSPPPPTRPSSSSPARPAATITARRLSPGCASACPRSPALALGFRDERAGSTASSMMVEKQGRLRKRNTPNLVVQ